MSSPVRRLAGPVAVVALLALAVLLALLAADVLRWQRQLERGDVRFASATGEVGMWTPGAVLPAGISRALLGVGDDVAFRKAVQRFWLSRPREPIRRFADITLRSGAERELARAFGSDSSRERRSALANLRGALALEEARGTPVQEAVLLRRAAASFRQAVALDGENDDAKLNLELTLRLLRRAAAGPGGGGGGRAETPASGAGAATSGSGY